MIRLPYVTLQTQAHRRLKQLQKKVDDETTYPKRVEAAKKHFSQQNKIGNKTFDEVKKALTKMCSGARRCAYCEDSLADEVEHIKPKDLYPEVVFDWENYVYACGPCNGPKNNQYAIFSSATGLIVDVTRKRNQPVVPPESGESAFINPRLENALDFMALDLEDTFLFVVISDEDSPEYQKADYTIKVLRLNERDILSEARREAYGHYRARLKEYIQERDNNATTQKLNALKRSLLKMQHPTVWAEMKRQRDVIPELKTLFDSAPEALNW